MTLAYCGLERKGARRRAASETESPFMNPLGKDPGQVRAFRTSPLTPVPAICLDVEPAAIAPGGDADRPGPLHRDEAGCGAYRPWHHGRHRRPQ